MRVIFRVINSAYYGTRSSILIQEEFKMSMETLLNGEIENRFEDLSELDVSSKEYSAAVDSVTKLMDRRLEIEKIEETAAQAEKQMKEDRKSRVVKSCIDVGSVVLPLAVTIWGVCISLEFEKTDTVTTSIGKKFMEKLISKK